jgi:hypothetical protein
MNKRQCRNKSRSIKEDHNNKPRCSKTNTPCKSATTSKNTAEQVETRLPKSPTKCCKVAKELTTVHGIPVQNAPNNKKQIHPVNPHTDKAIIAL